MIKGAYTWSKAINMTDDDGWAERRLELGSGVRPQSRRRRVTIVRTSFQMGWVYELPSARVSHG